jgi:hypothetical protein
MRKREFKVGDKVRLTRNTQHDENYDLEKGDIGNIEEIYGGDVVRVKSNKGVSEINVDGIELVGRGRPVKEKPEDLTKYMVYGTGCDNQSQILGTEKELKTKMKK